MPLYNRCGPNLGRHLCALGRQSYLVSVCDLWWLLLKVGLAPYQSCCLLQASCLAVRAPQQRNAGQDEVGPASIIMVAPTKNLNAVVHAIQPPRIRKSRDNLM